MGRKDLDEHTRAATYGPSMVIAHGADHEPSSRLRNTTPLPPRTVTMQPRRYMRTNATPTHFLICITTSVSLTSCGALSSISGTYATDAASD